MTNVATCGVHHVGLAVPDLGAAVDFFLGALGWKVVGGKDDYPATFVSDGTIMATLWQVADPATAMPFDRRTNVGLHHLALAVADDAVLQETFERVRDYPGVIIEFAPGPMFPGAGRRHFICAMPGGIRLEFTPRT